METLESINAWRPDWRKAESYPPIGNWSPVYKAWELLRRQREYQEDFIHFANGTIFEKYNHIALRDGDHWIITPDGERVFPQIYFSGKYLIGMLGVVVGEDNKLIRNKDGYPSPYKRACCLRPPCVNAPPRFTANKGVRTLTCTRLMELHRLMRDTLITYRGSNDIIKPQAQNLYETV